MRRISKYDKFISESVEQAVIRDAESICKKYGIKIKIKII